MGIIKSRSTPLLDRDLNNRQIIFNNGSTAGFDNTRNMALTEKCKKLAFITSFESKVYCKVIHVMDFLQLCEPTKIFSITENPLLSNELLPCEAITFSACSKVDSQVIYVATTHNLFSVDVRFPNRPLQSWRHCLSQPPVFLSQCNYSENKELLLLSSCLQKELVGITNEWNPSGPSPVSRYLSLK
jgi:hypothetical protein